MTPEAKVKKVFTDECRRLGIVPFSQILKAKDPRGITVNLELFRIRGIPDKMVLLRGGNVVFVELKAEGGRLSVEQERVVPRIGGLGFTVWVVRGERSAVNHARLLASQAGR